MKNVDLASAPWILEACSDSSGVPSTIRGRSFPARVPGCVHGDLIRAGVIGHPNIGFDEDACQWIGRVDWRYHCRFDVDSETLRQDRVELVLDGLDTVASIEVNSRHSGDAMNMHHAHRFDIKPLLHAGANDLVISLRGPVAYVEEQERQLGKRPVNGDWTPYSYIRKMASNFQWDWGPRVATCGIWRGARLEAWSGVRIAHVRPIVLRADPAEAALEVRIDIESGSNSEWDLAEIVLNPLPLRHGKEHSDPSNIVTRASASTRAEARATLTVPAPALWWPRGMGSQAMYRMNITVLDRDRRLDQRPIDLGLRQTRLLTQPDDCGHAFAIEINGVPIFCRGANWIPEGLFPEDQSPQRLRDRVQQAADANCNMLRVWGGGTYEQDEFYDACDELGILVWQDFMFACATYPEDDPYPALVEREAREAVARLAPHPSIVLWCGGNENILGYESWGWKQKMQRDQKWGERYVLDILPRVVSELDQSRPYWPDSPCSGSREIRPNDPDHGDRHTWDVKVEGYREIVPRFCSEFGHQSPPCWATMQETWGADQLRLDSRAMQHRQRATGGNDVWYGSKVMGGRFADPHSFDEWLYQAHLLQARAISVGIEWLRANQPRCMGALFWQFNDAWAGHSWSCIDSAGRKKPLWYAVRRSFAPRLLTIQPFGGALRLCAINETPSRWNPAVRIRRLRLTGEVLNEHAGRLAIEPGGVDRSLVIERLVGEADDPRGEFVVAECDVGSDGASRGLWFFEHDRTLALPPPRLEATMERRGGDVLLTLQARTLLRDVVLAVDRIDPTAEISDNLVTLLPGESCTLRVATKVNVPAAAWTSPPVLRCANEFSARAQA